MGKRSVLSAARELIKRQTEQQKAAYLEVLGQQWGAVYAEQVARKADFMSKKVRSETAR